MTYCSVPRNSSGQVLTERLLPLVIYLLTVVNIVPHAPLECFILADTLRFLLNVLFYIPTHILFYSVEKLLGMTTNLGSRSSPNVALNLLPVLSVHTHR